MSGGATRDWDAATYDRVSDPQYEWGMEVLGRLELHGDETVLDAGCGSGRLTAALIERLPRGRVIAVDASPSMIELARTRLRAHDQALVCDLLELDLSAAAHAVFSTAAFHWVSDHEHLFERLHAALAPGGVLVAQCGGEGNVAAFHTAVASVGAEEPFDHYIGGWGGPWNFASPYETARRLERAGFTRVECWLEAKRLVPEEPRAFAQTGSLGYHLERLPDVLREPFVDRVLARAGAADGSLELDYVRLNIDARRPA